MMQQNNPKTEANQINTFTGDHAFLSNFLAQPVIYQNRSYKSAEHAYQAAKAISEADHEMIQNASSPREARRLGGVCQFRPDWNDIKLEVMEEILISKFSQPHLRKKLLETSPKQLIEGNTWGDRFWGCEKEYGVWVGENNLGKLLMKMRDEYSSLDQ